jgi:hypothetical protein
MGGALLARWWGWLRVVIGATFSRPPVRIAAGLGVAWLIGLSIAAFGAIGTVALVVWVGVGLAGYVLLLLLVVRLITWVRGMRQERYL